MKLTRRQTLLIVWALCIIAAGILVCKATGQSELGWAAGLGLIAISLGVPLMRAFTEFSK